MLSSRYAAVLLVLVSGCATHEQPPTRCGDLQILQDGQALASDGLSVTIRRSPFTVRYLGQASTIPWLHATSASSPVNGLEKMEPRELWLLEQRLLPRQAGDLRLAGYEIRAASGPWSAEAGASGTPTAIVHTPEPPRTRYFARLPAVAFDRRDAQGQPVLRVDTIQGRPLADSRWVVLHLTALSNQQEPVSAPGQPTLQRVAWTNCTVFFH